MKVENKTEPPTFRPIKLEITIESEGEAQRLRTLLGSTYSDVVSGAIFATLFDEMNKRDILGDKMFHLVDVHTGEQVSVKLVKVRK